MTTMTHHARPSFVAPSPLFLQCAARPDQARVMRHAVSCYVQELCWPDDVVDSVTLAVGEAVNNAVSYGQECAGAEVSLCCHLAPMNALVIEVRNPGGHFQPDLPALSLLPDDFATHGRGFALMAMLMDEVQVFTEDQETVVRLVRRLSPAQSPDSQP